LVHVAEVECLSTIGVVPDERVLADKSDEQCHRDEHDTPGDNLQSALRPCCLPGPSTPYNPTLALFDRRWRDAGLR
jgi:hypothetical protein